MSALVLFKAASSISVRITWQPEVERATAVALPIPLAAPVMNAVFVRLLIAGVTVIIIINQM